ncbi:cytochrome P450 [Ganoderma sinense ZZ0214-1]|uniref:Cytochrome P450 n=1 Tax=Ganoderma sinense ZZ0214-1 TaxID=1077348 RepID=A0A2G8S3J4_9APHY|nr:cytochrome P450 [Ganoderma sinense ZZ0214-1]
MLSPTSESASTVTFLSVSALFVHQIFRKFETFSIPFHAFLLLVPPAIVSHTVRPTNAGRLTVSELAFCYTTYLGVLALSIVFYRLSPFHPLHQYPGPRWCRTSMLWHIIRTVDGKQTEYLRYLHDTYGDVVRIGPNHLSVRDLSLINPILGPSGIPRAATYKGVTLSDSTVPLIGIQDATEHARRRRPWNRGLAPSALKDYDHIMSHRVHQLVDVLGQQEGAVVLGKWISYFAYMHDGDEGNIWAMVDKGAQIAFHLGQVPWLGIYVGHIPGAGGPLNLLLEHGRALTKTRVARGSSTRDLFYYLNNEDIPEESPPPERHLLDDGVLAMIAGSDTSSSAITSVFHCLLAHPAAYAVLQDEVDRFYPRGEDVCDAMHHREMHYLTAVINETLRLFPPVPTSNPRQVPHTAPAPVVLGPRSLVLPPGTLVYVPPYVLHRDGRNFARPHQQKPHQALSKQLPDSLVLLKGPEATSPVTQEPPGKCTFADAAPDVFWPERWLVAAGHMPLGRALSLSQAQFELAHAEGAFVPFSHGPMNCAGKALALRQMRVVVCALLQQFHFRASTATTQSHRNLWQSFAMPQITTPEARCDPVL